jgi:hypothetical protein
MAASFASLDGGGVVLGTGNVFGKRCQSPAEHTAVLIDLDPEYADIVLDANG